MKKINFKAVSLSTVRFLLAVLLTVSALGTLLCGVASKQLLSSELYIKNCLSDEYYDAVYAAAEKAVIRATASVVTIGEDKIKEVLDRDTLAEISREYTEGYIKVIFDGAQKPEIDRYECEDMKLLVRETILDSVEEAGGEIPESQLETDSEEAYELLRGYVDISVKIFPTLIEDVMVTASSVIDRLSVLETAFPIGIAVSSVLAIAAVLLAAKHGVGSMLLSAVGPVWVGTAISTAPFVVLYLYDVTSRLSVEAGSALHIVLSGIINTIIDTCINTTGIAFAITSVLLVVSIVLASFVKKADVEKG